MAEENVGKRRREEEVENGVPEAKRPHAAFDAGLMAFLDGIDNMDRNDDDLNHVLKPLDEANIMVSLENNNNNFNFNDGFIDVAEELEMSYFHFCDEDGGLMALYSTHHGFVPDYTEVNDFCHVGTLWEDDIWQLEKNQKQKEQQKGKEKKNPKACSRQKKRKLDKPTVKARIYGLDYASASKEIRLSKRILKKPSKEVDETSKSLDTEDQPWEQDVKQSEDEPKISMKHTLEEVSASPIQ